MTRPRAFHTATLLTDGTVLVAGSLTSDASAELYDPEAGTWTSTGSMQGGRHDFTATLLPDGRVLAGPYEGSSSAEIYDPAAGSWTQAGNTRNPQIGTYTATLLRDGTVLVAGGAPNRHERAELYDARTGTWTPVPDMLDPRHFHTATLLPDGTVLIAGGRGTLASAELYVP
jgi:hypothetical protein